MEVPSAITLKRQPPASLDAQGHQNEVTSRSQVDLIPSSSATATLPPLSRFLPDELLLRIFCFFPVGDPATFRTLLALKRVSKRLSKVASDSAIWRPHLANDYTCTMIYPNLFSEPEDYGDSVAARYYELKARDYDIEVALEDLVRASSGQGELLDELCILKTPGVEPCQSLRPLVNLRAEADPQYWLAKRYWAKVASETIHRVDALRTWANVLKTPVVTGFGEECLALASFVSYIGKDRDATIGLLAELKLSSVLEDHALLDDMLPQDALTTFAKAFRSSRFYPRSWSLSTIFLGQLLYLDYHNKLVEDLQHLAPPSTASLIICVTLLRKVSTVLEVAIMHIRPEWILAITFRNHELLFLEVTAGAIMTRHEVALLHPSLGPDLELITEENLLPPQCRMTVASLLHRTEEHLSEALRRFEDDHLPLPYDLSSDCEAACDHLKLLRLLLMHPNPSLPLVLTAIPHHTIFERQTLNRVIHELARDLSKAELTSDALLDVVFVDDTTEEDLDSRFPSYQSIQSCMGVEDVAPKDFVSFLTGGEERKWFPRGYSFMISDSNRSTLVVIAFERVEEQPLTYNASYLCLKLSLLRRGHVHYEFVTHSTIEIASPRPFSSTSFIEPLCEVGQFFRTISPEGLLVPNAWLERMLLEMDQKESAVEEYLWREAMERRAYLKDEARE